MLSRDLYKNAEEDALRGSGRAQANKSKTPAGSRRYQVKTRLEGCGVDGGDAAFDGDAFDFDGFGEDGALKAIGKDFQDVADFGSASWVAQNMHGLRFDLIHAHADGEALGLFRGALLGRERFLGGRSRSRLALGGLFDDGLFHREIIQANPLSPRGGTSRVPRC